MHRVEYRQPAGRTAPAAPDTMRTLAGRLFPHWREALRAGHQQGRCGRAGHGERHELARGRERLRALIEFALGEGWRVCHPAGT